jgi:NADH-quinone oxidoreductase subunit C
MVFKKIADSIIKEFYRLNYDCSQIKFNFEIDFTIEIVGIDKILFLLNHLKNDPLTHCQQLIDLCGVDYLAYGIAEWDTSTATNHGFSRAVQANNLLSAVKLPTPTRFAIVYHLLSYTHNLRIRVKCFLDDDNLLIPSCTKIWPSANWYEREVFDLFGISFIDHPNLSRILTEEHFVGFPLRKDFPLTGEYEVRFDANMQQVVREPIDVEPYNVVPKVIR